MTAATSSPHTGVRDALTVSYYAGLAMWAWFLYGFGSMLPLLRAEQGTSRTVMGLHSLLLAVGAIVAGLTVVPLVTRLRRRGVAQLGMAMIVVGTAVLCLVLSPWVTLPAALLTGTGGAMVINSITAAATQHHGPAAAAVLSEANAVAALIGLVAPLGVGAASAAGLSWRPAILAVVPLTGLAAWSLRRVPSSWTALDGAPTPTRPAAAGRLPTAFWFLIGAIMTATGIEFCCTAWSADLLRQSTTLSAGSASAAVSLFVAGLFAGRSIAGRLARRHRPEPLLAVGVALILTGWAVLWLSHAAAPALAGLALLGLGVSVQYPLIAALAYATPGGSGDRISGALSLSIGVAAGLGPFAIGALADATSTHAAFLLVPLLATVTLTLLTGRRYLTPPGAAGDR